MPLNLPSVPRKSSKNNTFKALTIKGWFFSSNDMKKFSDLGLTEENIQEIVDFLPEKQIFRFSLGEFLYEIALAGIESKYFIDIAKSGVLNVSTAAEIPRVTVLRQYVSAYPTSPLMALLAYRAGISFSELSQMSNNDDFTEENLRAMIDLTSSSTRR